jgi:hypothetical protein
LWEHLSGRGGDALAAAVAAGDDGAADLARHSLGEELATVRSEHVKQALEAEGTELHRAVIRRIAAEYEDLMDSLWLGGALAGLAAVANTQSASDAELAIRHLEDVTMRNEAGWLLAATATPDHVDALISAPDSIRRNEVRWALLERAVADVGPVGALERVAAAEGAERLLRQVLTILADQELEVAHGDVVPYLVSRNSGVRRAALRVLIAAMSQPETRRLLNEVASQPPRYYDVVGLLDRIVHGPDFAKERARRALKDE